MTASSWEKILNQVGHKPGKKARVMKHNAPKPRSCGKARMVCQRCGRKNAVIKKYGLYLCRQCFREIAEDIGFINYS